MGLVICDILSEYIGRPVEYLESSKQFAIKCSNEHYQLIKLESNNTITFDQSYCFTPDIIVLIGKFFVGKCEYEYRLPPVQPNPKPSPGSLKKLTEGLDVEAYKKKKRMYKNGFKTNAYKKFIK